MLRFRNPGKLAAPLLAIVVVAALLHSSPHLTFGAEQAAAVPMLYGSAPDAPDSQLQAIVEDVVGNIPGTWGVAVKKLDTGQYAQFNGDRQQVSASLYKMWVLAELFRQAKAGIVQLDGYASVSGEDAYYDSLMGDLHFSVGDSVSLRRAAYQMITVSDNTAAHLLVRNLGPDNVNAFMQQNGLTHSQLDWSGIGDNFTTPLDVLREMEMIATSDMVDAEASKQMIEMMMDQQINDLLPTGLPDGTRFAHKTGSLDGLLHDAGIVYGPSGPFIIVAMSSDLDSYKTSWDNMQALARRVYNYFSARPSSPALFFPETKQSVGHEFLKMWNAFGGLEAFGYPIGPEMMRDGLLIQQFERARMEWRPDANEASRLPVGLGALGQERANQLGLTWAKSSAGGDGKYFAETGQSLSGGFYQYWLNNGGERIFGKPISPAANMVSPADGKTYQTQWFERSRLEFHPELPAGQRIIRAALGTETLSGR